VTRGRIDGLDLLRGIAVGLVMLRHALPDVFSGAGVVGVVMFFALSGYLITGVLERKPSLTTFYARRAWRLVPPLLVLVAGVVVVTLVLDPLDDRDELLKTVVVALTWTADLPFGHASDATYHLWTLALEEQFYLLWPVTLLVLGPRRGLVLAALATTLACGLTTWWLAEDPDLAYSLPTSWALCFVVGAAARLHGDRLRLPSWTAPVALTTLAVLSMVPLRGHALTYLAGGPAIAVLTAALVLSWRTWTTVTGPLRALVWLGTVSYAAYLWNYPLTLWLRPYAGLAVALTLVAAALSWRYVEAPLARRRVAVAA
jgi:peptidoglycan/LPS O-acetylase OafA/YrhL